MRTLVRRPAAPPVGPLTKEVSMRLSSRAGSLALGALGLVPCLAALGCSGDKDSGDAGGEDSVYTVMSGFHHSWNQLSHRVSLSEIAVLEDGTIASGIIGGDFSTGDVASDYVHFRVSQSRVTGSGLVVGHGVVEVVVGPDGVVDETVSIDVPGIGGFSTVTAAFTGFRVSSDTAQGSDYPADYDPALGYTTKGWAFSVGEPSLSGDTATLAVSGVKRWAPTNNDTDPADRSDMNGAIPFAQSEVAVHFAVIGFDGTLTTGGGTASIDYDNGNYSEQPPLTETDLGVSVATDGTGFPIIRSYDLLLEDQLTDEFGDYIRSYGVELSDADPLSISTELTNSSLLEIAAIRFTPTVDVAWVGLSGDAEVETVVSEGSHAIGSVTFDPAEPPVYTPE